MFHFTAYIIAPEDSVYRHKLVKLQFEIPPNYPLVPPVVKFIQHSGERIHPNLYVDGKVCLSILGTWPGEPWAFGMKCNSVLITIRSLLDNQPYCHEPNQRDNPAFNEYVRYATWRWLLLDYLDHETNPAARAWLRRYVRRNGREMLAESRRQARVAEGGDALRTGTRATTAAATVPVPGLGHDKFLRSPYKRLEPLLPAYDPIIEKLETVWASTLTEETLNFVSDGGSGKRKIDAVEKAEENTPGGQKQTPEQSKGSAASHEPLAAPPPSSTEQSQAPKKRARKEPEVVDLT